MSTANLVRFLCINGHRLAAPREQIGKTGKCPHCGTIFRIPTDDDAGLSGGSGRYDLPASLSGVEPAGEPASGVEGSGANNVVRPNDVSSGANKRPPLPPQIEFLCPNGHQLKGPLSMAGKPGQCPHCAARFVIPTEEEFAEHESSPPEAVSSPQPVLKSSAANGAAVASAPVESAAPKHPLARLYEQLASHCTTSSVIELYFEGGERIVPEGYVPSLSREDHAVFARKEANGATNLTAIAWERIVRIDLRGLWDLPEGFVRELE